MISRVLNQDDFRGLCKRFELAYRAVRQCKEDLSQDEFNHYAYVADTCRRIFAEANMTIRTWPYEIVTTETQNHYLYEEVSIIWGDYGYQFSMSMGKQGRENNL